MNKKSIIYILAMAVAFIFAFVGIIVMCELTEWRDLSEFSPEELDMFAVFIVIEVILVAAALVFAILAGRAGREARGEAVESTKYEKALALRGVAVLLLSFGFAILMTVIGAFLYPYVKGLGWLFVTLLVIGCLTLPVAILVNYILTKSFNAKIAGIDKRELQKYVYSQREEAKVKAAALIERARGIILATDIYAAVIGTLGALISLSAGALGIGDTVIFTLLSAVVISAALSRIRLGIPKVALEDGGFVEREEYPEVYRVAEEAREALGVKGEIRLAIGYDCNASIMRTGDCIAIVLGVVLLNLLSREELYAILCHELGHLLSEENGSSREAHYNDFISERGIRTLFTTITEKAFTYPDVVYSLTYLLYTYASTLGVEEAADEAMREYGNPRAAASGLLKINFYDLFLWERGSAYDDPTLLYREELQADLLQYQLNLFARELEVRKEAWCELIRVEILSRSSTHPTLRMRLEALGVTDYELYLSEDSEEYAADVAKATESVEREVYESRLDSYAEERHEGYELPLAEVEAWKAEGEPLVAEKYRDIIEALRTLGRNAEAEALADRAIAELSGAAVCYAHYIKGAMLLHRFDEAGIEHLYHAIENNKNYIEEGLEIIGRYCCLSGKEDELEHYRARALELQETELSTYDELGVIRRSDDLVEERLEGDMMERLVAYIDKIDGGRIDEVYIVRKNITEDFFSSCVIVRIKRGVDDEERWNVMHEMFSYLDTSSDWQYSLFSYENAPMLKVKRIEGSLIWQAKE